MSKSYASAPGHQDFTEINIRRPQWTHHAAPSSTRRSRVRGRRACRRVEGDDRMVRRCFTCRTSPALCDQPTLLYRSARDADGGLANPMKTPLLLFLAVTFLTTITAEASPLAIAGSGIAPPSLAAAVHGCHSGYSHDVRGWHRHEKGCKTQRGFARKRDWQRV